MGKEFYLPVSSLKFFLNSNFVRIHQSPDIERKVTITMFRVSLIKKMHRI